MSAYVLPALIIFLLLYSIYKKTNAYKSFTNGAASAFDLILSIFPYLVAILMLFEIYTTSGLNNTLSSAFSPLFTLLGVPPQLIELIIIKNFSGAGGIAMLENILQTYGADSYLGRCASVIAASSEAVFFVAAVYFAKTKVEKYGKVIAIALITNFISVVLACQLCKIL